MLHKSIREEPENNNAYLIEVGNLPDNVDEQVGDVFPPETVKDFIGTGSEQTSQDHRQKLMNLNTQQKVRLALVANRATRSLLIQSPIKMIPLAVLKNPKLTEIEILNYAQQRNLVEDVALAIAKDTKWMRNYQVKLAIVSNPKTPLSVAIKFMPHLHDNDLKSLSRDKTVSSILSRAAYTTLLKRKK